MLLMRSNTFTDDKALANKENQIDSTSTPAAEVKAANLSAYEKSGHKIRI